MMLDSVLGLFAADRLKIEMERPSFVLAAMAAGGPGARFDAIRLQNLLLVIDREVAADSGGPHFDFKPDPYGPHDPAVLETADRLVVQARAELDRTVPCWAYCPTDAGHCEGLAELDRMPGPASDFVVAVASWVQSRSFRAMLAGIFERYPDIAVDSGIPLHGLRSADSSLERHPFLRGIARTIGICRRRGESSREGADPIAADWWAVGDDLRRAMERVLPDIAS